MPLLTLAQTAEDHMRRGRQLEMIGWALAVLSFVILFVGVAWSIRRDRRKKQQKQQTQAQQQTHSQHKD